MPEKTTFKWSNYFKPTPDNLQYLATGLKSITLLVGGSAYVMGNEKIGFFILLSGAVLDELSKFFARVSHDMKESIEIESTIKITHKVENDEENKPA